MESKSNRRTRSASSSSSAPPAKRQKITVAPFAAAFPRRTLLSSSRWVNLPEDIWVHQILHPFLDLEALATLGRCNTFFHEYWQYVLKQNVIRVPEGCPTMNQAVDLAVVFSERNDCTRENPVKIEVGEGEHAMVGVAVDAFGGLHTHVSCSNIAIVGKGGNKTTILGGFYVDGKQGVTLEQLAVTNEAGFGLRCTGGGANVDVSKCCFKKCRYDGMDASNGATATVTRCDFMENGYNGVACSGVNVKVRLNDSTIHHNRQDGLFVRQGATATATRCECMENGQCGVACHDVNTKVRLYDCTMHHNGVGGLGADDHVVVNLHGTETDIHANKEDGIAVYNYAKVNIHLPFQHNTSHDNADNNRTQIDGGSIANINADGTFTHVVVDEHDGWVTE